MRAEDIVDGIYRIATAMDHRYVWDIKGESTAQNADLQIYTQNNGKNLAGNHQRFRVETIGNLKRITAVHSGKVIEVYGRTTIPTDQPDNLTSNNMSQHSWNGGNNQLWRFSDETDSAGDECIGIMSAMNTNYVADAKYAIAQPGKTIQLHKKNSGAVPQQADNQKWAFTRETVYAATMAVPWGVTALDGGTAAGTQLLLEGDGAIVPAWRYNGTGKFQCRYRARVWTAGQAGEWSDWTSPYAEEPGDDGWGDCWTDFITPATAGQYLKLPQGGTLPVSFGPADRVDVQFGVRMFDPAGKVWPMATNGPVVSGEVVTTFTARRRRHLTLFDFRKTKDGLSVRYEFDGVTAVGIRNLTIKDANGTVVDKFTGQWTAMSPAGTLLVPTDKLSRIPANNTQLTVSCEYVYGEVTDAASQNGVVAYDATHGLEVTCQAQAVDGWALRVTVPQELAGAQVYLQAERDGRPCLSHCTGSVTKGFLVAPLVGEQAKITVVAVSNDNQWGEAEFDLPAVSGMPESYVLTWDGPDGAEWAQLPMDCGLTRTTAAEHESFLANGETREHVYFGDGARSEIQLSGTVAAGSEADHAGYRDMERLASARYATLRTPSGERLDVAVINVDQRESARGWRSVSVTCKERA